MSHSKTALAVILGCLGSSVAAHAEVPIMPSITVSNVIVTEGNSGQTAFSAQVIVPRYTSATFTLKVTATPGTADESDYILTTTELTLPGDGGQLTVTGFIVGDTRPEEDEYFTLNVTAVGVSYIPSGYGTVTIKDDDQALASRLHVQGARVIEGNAGVTYAEVSVRLEPPTTNTVTVVYDTKDGTAFAGSDYQAASGTLTFAPSEVEKTISIGILGDTELEPDESFDVVLSKPDMALLGTFSADVHIVTDEEPVHETIADVTVDEGNEGIKLVPITVTFDRALPNVAKVEVTTVAAGALAGLDFKSFSDVLVANPGATSITFNLEVLSDTTPECDEGLFIRYTAYYTGDTLVKTAKVLLRNDDGAVGACPDPFVSAQPPEPPRDGGWFPLPPEPALDGGVQGPPSFIDAGGTGLPDARATSGPEVGIVVGPLPTPDAQTLPDSSVLDVAGSKLGNSAGCSCAVGASPGQAGGTTLVLAVLFFVGRGLRRPQRRPR